MDAKIMTCKAFPDGIPGVILSNEMPHYLPVVGQVGDYVYEKDLH